MLGHFFGNLGIELSDESLPGFATLLDIVFREAVTFQKLARQGYLSSEFVFSYPEPTLPGEGPRLVIDPATMEDEERSPASGYAAAADVAVVATMSFGLVQKKIREKFGRGAEEESEVLLKARVLTSKLLA